MPRLTINGLLLCSTFRRQPRSKPCPPPTEATEGQEPSFEPSSSPSPLSTPLSLTPSSPPFSSPSSSPFSPPTPLPSPLLSPLTSPVLPVQTSDFLWLPVDVVLYLCSEHLPPVAAVALSLTCKAMFGLVFPTAAPGLAKTPSERESLQLLLEKDLGQHWWYCHGCSLLHPIRSRGPTTDLPTGRNYRRRIHWDPGRYYHNSHWFEGTSFVLDYEAVRLVMNRHFLGPPNGLPLDSFSVEAIPNVCRPWQGRLLPWQERWSARILQDELFLSATRTLSGAGWTDEDLRAALDHETRHVCGHVLVTSRLPFPVVNPLRRTSGVSPACFVQCRDVVESCGECLTDYTTTVERRLEHGEQQVEPWFITITSYHQLGSGRSATDVKLHTFGQRTTAASYFNKRDMVTYPPRSIKAAWDSHES